MLTPLPSLPIGKTATIGKMKIKDGDTLNRLKQLNLRLGVAVKIIQADPGYPLLIGIGDARVALNLDLAKRIYVVA